MSGPDEKTCLFVRGARQEVKRCLTFSPREGYCGVPVKAFIFDMDDVLCRYDVGRRIELLSELSARSPREIRS